MKSFKNSIYFSSFLVTLSMISVTTGASLAKSLFPALGAEGTTVVRLGLGAILLLLMWKPWKFELNAFQFRIVVLYGLCLGMMNLLFYLAINRIPLGIAIAIEFIGPLTVALMLSKKILDLFWAFLAAVGIALILPLSDLQQSLDPIGIIFAAGAAVMWGIYILLGKKAGAILPSGIATSLGVTSAFLFITPFGASDALNIFSHTSLIPIAIAVGILSTAIPYSLEMTALKKMSPSHFGIFLSLEPAIGSLVGLIFLNEHLTLIQCAAVLCIMVASVGSTVAASRK